MLETQEKVTALIEQFHLLSAAGEIVVAVSGGVDSLCLLHILHRLCGPGKRYANVALHVAHLDHRLRGAEGERDAARVAQLAAAWELPVTIGSIDVPALARTEHRSLEDAARAARYRFLRQIAQGRLIAVAHQADDQVETLLLHYLRGGGLRGMVGMPPRQQDIIRPLLALTRAETAAYCRAWNLTPLEDASNSDPRFLRNRIRHELLPLLESLNPGIRATLLRSAEVMQVDLDWIEEQVTWLWPRIMRSAGEESLALEVDLLWKLPLSLQRHLLRRVAETLCNGQSPLELRHYRLIEELSQRGATGEERALHLPGQLTVTRRLNALTFERRAISRERHVFSTAQEMALLPIPGHVVVPGTGWIAIAEQLGGEDLEQMREALAREDQTARWQLLPSRSHTVYIDSESIGLFLQVRTRKPGDRIQPLGMAQEKKVQDVMVDQHVPRAERARTPLFFSATHCVWVAGVCIDERVKLTSTTRGIIRLSIETTTESDTR